MEPGQEKTKVWKCFIVNNTNHCTEFTKTAVTTSICSNINDFFSTIATATIVTTVATTATTTPAITATTCVTILTSSVVTITTRFATIASTTATT